MAQSMKSKTTQACGLKNPECFDRYEGNFLGIYGCRDYFGNELRESVNPIPAKETRELAFGLLWARKEWMSGFFGGGGSWTENRCLDILLC